jgi:hypothetical protein
MYSGFRFLCGQDELAENSIHLCINTSSEPFIYSTTCVSCPTKSEAGGDFVANNAEILSWELRILVRNLNDTKV